MTSTLFMRKTALLAFLILSGYGASAQHNTKDRLDSLMSHYVNTDDFNGTVMVVRKGNVLLSKGYGFRDLEGRVPNDVNTIYPIATVTQAFTAELMLQLDSQGKLGLDDPVKKYIPDYPRGETIRLKNLLTHTSGIYNYTQDTLWRNRPERPVATADLIKTFKNRPLAFIPGQRFDYSNSNYALAGYIADRIMQWRYEYQVRDQIFNACGMNQSGFDYVNLQHANKATGYINSGKGQNKKAPAVDSSQAYAALGMYSTVGDLYKWHKALQSFRLLPKDWQDIAYAPYKNGYALGWQAYFLAGKTFVLNTGSIPGYSATLMRQRDDDVFIVLLENTSRANEHGKAIATAIVQALYDKPLIASRK